MVAVSEYATLGPVVTDWIQRHCVIPDGPHMGEPFVLTDEMVAFVNNFYAVDVKAQRWAFPRGAQLMRPQKWGKGPFSAALICAEAAGPVFPVFDENGELVSGRAWDTPWIQVTAVSEDQTANVFRALLPMIQLSDSLNMEIADTGLTRVNLPGGGYIEPVTASARSRLGQRITFAVQDEALALDTLLPTPSGWTTMGDVRAGDVLIGADGRPTRVVKTTGVQEGRSCYRVTFSDETSVVASDGHLWATRVCGSAALPRVRSTGDMARDGRRFRIPAPRPFDLPEQDLPVDPYFLGYWLGDGSTGQPYIAVGDEDLSEACALLAACGAEITSSRSGGAHRVGFSNGRGYQGQERPALAKALQSLGCYRAKHVPAEYFRGSYGQREALLQGLMDSDGHVTADGQCTFVGSDQLSRDLLTLLRTLGHVGKRTWRADERSRHGGLWKVNFCPRGDLQPFRLSRKAKRVRRMRGGCDWVTITAIEPVESVPVRCVEVDAPDHLFLAGEAGHVTHNTHSWVQTNGGLQLADNQRRNLAGMSGRFIETTNAYDPVENSVAQRTFENEPGVLLDDREPVAGSVRNKRERRKVLKQVYGDSWWVDLDRIEDEIDALVSHGDGAQAERFFLNRKIASEGAAFDVEAFKKRAKPGYRPEKGAVVVMGVDGARHDDAIAVVATEVKTGFQWVVKVIERPEGAGDDYEHDLNEVDGAVSEVFGEFNVWRMYCDPHWLELLVEKWQNRYGQKVVLEWLTNAPRKIGWAVRNYQQAIGAGDLSHDGSDVLVRHVANARKKMLNVRDDDERLMHTLSKVAYRSALKIDAAMAAVVSWEARGDCIAAGGVSFAPVEPDPDPVKPLVWTPGEGLPGHMLVGRPEVGPLGGMS